MTTLENHIANAAAIKAYLESLREAPPEPEPIPEPDLSTKPPDIIKRVDESHLLNFSEWNGSARYTRATRLTVWKEDNAIVVFDCQDMSVSGGGRRRPMYNEYTLLIDGKPYATTQVNATEFAPAFRIDTRPLSDGWHVLDISEHDDETSVPYPVFVFRGDSLPKQDWIPVFTGRHEIREWHHIKWVPAVYNPLPWPLKKRAFPHFDYIPHKDNTFVEMLTGGVQAHARRLNVNKDGILSAATKQDYFWSDLIAKKPVVELLDGPRGTNVVTMVTHISVGRARQEDKPDSPLLDNVYLTTPWSFCRVSPNGTVTTLAGFRHKSPPSYWEDEPDLELVGDWSAIEPDRRQFHELWGQCWLATTLGVDDTADPIPEENNRIPHIVGPVAIVADSQMNALRAIEFSLFSHKTPARISEFYRGDDLWACVAWRNKVIASERGKHRIIQLDSIGNLERVIVEGEPLAKTNYLRIVKRIGTLDACRAQDTVSPEGLAIVGDWLYYADSAQEQVRAVHLVDGRKEIIVKSLDVRHFAQIAASKGDAGEKGTIFAATWNVGKPDVYTPDGRKWALEYPGHLDRGRGNSGFSGMSYSTAVGCGNGRILYGSAMEGIRQISLANDNDPVIDAARYRAGKQEWENRGYYLSHGNFGDSPFGLALPWGESTNMDYFLEMLGHEG